MADIRINALATTATTPASDDYLALDGAAQGTRKILATNIANNVTDVILGSSGPSVKSTLSARAPRQGLVFDGTAGATISSISVGTSDFTFAAWINPTTVASASMIVGSGANPTAIDIEPGGTLRIQKQGTSVIDSTSTISSGKFTLISYTRSGTTGTWYINGIASGTGSDSTNYNAFTQFGDSGYFTSLQFKGVLIPLIYNRALSASEVVALYEAGAPAGADYNNATNTAFTNGTFANVGYSTFSGASATGFVATYSGGGEAAATSQIANLSVAPGRKYLIKFDLTLTSGTAPYVGLAQFGVQWLTGSAAVTTGQVRAAAGANSIVVTIRSVNATFATNAGVGFASQEASSFTVSNLTATPLGLLLAPDAAQAGGGLVWYDTSGNAANITLPASGVSWNVPSSLKTASGWTFGGDTRINSTAVKGTGGASPLILGSATGGANDFNLQFFRSAAGLGDSYYALQSVEQGVSYRNITLNPNGGNVLVGTATDGGNGKLQLATHTTSAGGIGFGTDTSLYRAGAGALYANSSGSTNLFGLTISGTRKSLWYFDGTDTLFGADTGSLKLVSNGTTALTLDSSQSATFAGTGRFNGAAAGAVLNLKETAGVPTALNLTNRNSTQTWSVAVDGASVDDKLLSFIESGSVRFSLAATTGNATFAGDITISSAYPKINLTDTNNNSDFSVLNDNGRLAIYDETNAAYRFTVGATGGIKVGSTPEDVGANNFKVQGDTIIATKTPASASATGTAGTIAWDASYIYVCTATNTWKRVAIATWP